MVYSVFLHPIGAGFDVDAVKRYLEAMPDVFLDPLGTPTYVVCGVPEAVEHCRAARIKEPDRFPYSVLVTTIQPDVINVFQEYGDEYGLRSARDFVRWVIERQPCLVKDEYYRDWTEQVQREGVGVLYPPWLDQPVADQESR
jgi:hypothetical protein